MAVDYAVYLYNDLPNKQGVSAEDLFTGVTSPRHKMKDCHMWEVLVYVSDPKLALGKNLPRWKSCSIKGMFIGFSQVHSSDVP